MLDFLEDDGQPIEPKYYLPVIPMILVNGTEGIGTGFSTSIPNHNPLDIIEWLENKINKKPTKYSIKPYFKNFKGAITKYDDVTWVSSGTYTIDQNLNELTINELPLKLWTNDYKEFLEELIYPTEKSNKTTLFKSYINLSSDVDVKFVLKFDPDNYNKIKTMDSTLDIDKLNILTKYLKLYKTIKQSNMNLYTVDYQIKTFKNTEEILEDFYKWRLGFYGKRKNLMLAKLNASIKMNSNQINWIKLVAKDNGKIFKLDEKSMKKYLIDNKIEQVDNSYDYLTSMTFKQLTRANLEKMETKLLELKKQHNQIDLLTDNDLWLNDLKELKMLLII